MLISGDGRDDDDVGSAGSLSRAHSLFVWDVRPCATLAGHWPIES